jgi:hypothetical protein
VSDLTGQRAALKAALASLDDILDNAPTQLTKPELSVVLSHRMAAVTRATHELADVIHPPLTKRSP